MPEGLIQVWLAADLDAQPIEGTLNPPGGPPVTFVGWLGLTAALEALKRAKAEAKPPEEE